MITKHLAIMNKDSRIFIAGATGLVGSEIIRKLSEKGYQNILGTYYTRTPEKFENVNYVRINLLNTKEVKMVFNEFKPEYVFFAAAKVGGIHANNTYRAQFIYENLQINNNIIHESHLSKVKKLLFLGSSCIYPKSCPQPIKESYLLSGELEPTNEPYAIAKIAGLKMCEAYKDQYGSNFISAMPTNLYGRNDNYDKNNSHVLPALIRKFHEAKVNKEKYVTIWGTGISLREFMHVDDLAEALILVMNEYEEMEFINIGTGQEISIKELALMIKRIIGFDGELRTDPSKPDGTPRKLLEISKLKKMGFEAKISLEDGISKVYQNYKEQHHEDGLSENASNLRK